MLTRSVKQIAQRQRLAIRQHKVGNATVVTWNSHSVQRLQIEQSWSNYFLGAAQLKEPLTRSFTMPPMLPAVIILSPCWVIREEMPPVCFMPEPELWWVCAWDLVLHPLQLPM